LFFATEKKKRADAFISKERPPSRLIANFN
jgi:hypothetical protein